MRIQGLAVATVMLLCGARSVPAQFLTQAMKPGDTFEVEIKGVGVLRNPVVAERR